MNIWIGTYLICQANYSIFSSNYRGTPVVGTLYFIYSKYPFLYLTLNHPLIPITIHIVSQIQYSTRIPNIDKIPATKPKGQEKPLKHLSGLYLIENLGSHMSSITWDLK